MLIAELSPAIAHRQTKMIKSMTGYGKATAVGSVSTVSVELKSVNNRFFDFSARCPRGCSFLEERLKSYVQQRVSRGKIDMLVTIDFNIDEEAAVELNRPLAASYIAALRRLAGEFGLTDDISVSTVARNPEIFNVKKSEISDDEIWSDVLPALTGAVDGFIAMREVEGQKLAEDVIGRTESILSMVEKVEVLMPQTVTAYRERLYAKLREVLDGKDVDEQRIVTEAAIFADKVAVDEETVRLRSHISQFRSLIDSGEAVGRKLDFIVQEMNREANTIGSKSQNAELQMVVVDIKAEIEKIREQIQNIE